METDSQSFFSKILNNLKNLKKQDTTTTFAKGRSGEKKASIYLKKRGFKIIEHNFRWYGNEIDIVAKDKKSLVFVEVKSSMAQGFEHPLSWISDNKQKRIIKASNGYIVSHGLTESMVRFDVVAIEPDGKINHIIDAFRP
jgi:putative endonuclease